VFVCNNNLLILYLWV